MGLFGNKASKEVSNTAPPEEATPYADPQTMNSDEIVESLQPYGVVRVFQHSDGGFSSTVNLRVTGMKAEVSSGFGHNTMHSALTSAYTRTMGVITPGQAHIENKE